MHESKWLDESWLLWKTGSDARKKGEQKERWRTNLESATQVHDTLTSAAPPPRAATPRARLPRNEVVETLALGPPCTSSAPPLPAAALSERAQPSICRAKRPSSAAAPPSPPPPEPEALVEAELPVSVTLRRITGNAAEEAAEEEEAAAAAVERRSPPPLPWSAKFPENTASEMSTAASRAASPPPPLPSSARLSRNSAAASATAVSRGSAPASHVSGEKRSPPPSPNMARLESKTTFDAARRQSPPRRAGAVVAVGGEAEGAPGGCCAAAAASVEARGGGAAAAAAAGGGDPPCARRRRPPWRAALAADAGSPATSGHTRRQKARKPVLMSWDAATRHGCGRREERARAAGRSSGGAKATHDHSLRGSEDKAEQVRAAAGGTKTIAQHRQRKEHHAQVLGVVKRTVSPASEADATGGGRSADAPAWRKYVSF